MLTEHSLNTNLILFFTHKVNDSLQTLAKVSFERAFHQHAVAHQLVLCKICIDNRLIQLIHDLLKIDVSTEEARTTQSTHPLPLDH